MHYSWRFFFHRFIGDFSFDHQCQSSTWNDYLDGLHQFWIGFLGDLPLDLPFIKQRCFYHIFHFNCCYVLAHQFAAITPETFMALTTREFF